MDAFATGNADMIRKLLARRSFERSGDSSPVFRERAVALIGAIVPALVWLRDNKGISLDIAAVRLSIELRRIWRLAMEKRFAVRGPGTGIVTEIDVSNDAPEDIIQPLKVYLAELPGYDPSVSIDEQRSQEPYKLHVYLQFLVVGGAL